MGERMFVGNALVRCAHCPMMLAVPVHVEVLTSETGAQTIAADTNVDALWKHYEIHVLDTPD